MVEVKIGCILIKVTGNNIIHHKKIINISILKMTYTFILC